MDLRQETAKWIAVHGSKKSWIAKQLGCTPQHLYYYLLGEREMSQEKINKLQEIISQ